MANVLVTWTVQSTEFPEGTSPADHYAVHLGTLMASVPLGSLECTFVDVMPGDYPSAVEVIAMDGTVLGRATGNTVHVPQPVSIPMPLAVQVQLV